MDYIFKDTTLMSIDIEKSYSSNNNALFNTTKKVDLQGILYNRKKNTDGEGVKESILDTKEILNSISGQYAPIEINGYFLGSGIIKSVNFTEKNPIFIGKYKYSIEIIENNDFGSLSGVYYGSSLPLVQGQIESFDENFNFNYDSSKYDYSHDLKIKVKNLELSNEETFSKIKNFASQIFNDNLNYGLYGDFSGYYNILKTKKNYFSETYNSVNGECFFSKKIQIDKNLKNNYSISLNHIFNIKNDGSANITEEGEILLISPDAQNFDEIINLEKDLSFSRCNNFFINYADIYSGQYFNLSEKPLEFGKTFEPQKSQARYKVIYTNDVAHALNYYLEYSINKSIDGAGIQTDNEKGNILIYKNSNVTSQDIFEIRKSQYPKILQDSFSYPSGNYYPLENFKNMNYEYSISNTSDPSYFGPNNTIKYLKIKTSDKKPTPMIKEYVIVNHNTIKSLGNQNNLGEKTFEIKGVGKNLTFRELRNLMAGISSSQTFSSVVEDEGYTISLNGDFEGKKVVAYDS
jgi:hypothetical protein